MATGCFGRLRPSSVRFVPPAARRDFAAVYTVPVALNALVDSTSNEGVGTLMAMSLLSLAPILCFFAFAQKYLIKGISTTGLK